MDYNVYFGINWNSKISLSSDSPNLAGYYCAIRVCCSYPICYSWESIIGLRIFSYIYWTIIEILIIYVMIKHGYIQRRKAPRYLTLVCVMTCIMCYLVAIKGHMFFFSYFNTFIGEIFWLLLIFKKDYPMKPLALAAFITKFVGDLISIPTYLGSGIWLIDIICVLLPALDFLFIIVYINRVKKRKITPILK